MKTWLEILDLIKSGENEKVEFKRGLPSNLKKTIGKAICAFANTKGGVIILGVEDKTGKIVGVKKDKKDVQEKLTKFLDNGCSAPVSAHPECYKAPEGWVHWIDVPRLRGPEPLRCDDRVFVRRGCSNVAPSQIERLHLYNDFGFIRTEDRAIQASGPESIDMDSFRAYFRAQDFDVDEEPQPSEVDDLKNQRVVVEFDGELRATLYGILAFGKEPQRYRQTGNFWIECVAYKGEGRASDPLIVSDAKGRLDEQIKRATGWFQGLGRTELYRDLIREDRLLLPLKAVREALVNAVVHRDYTVTGAKTLFEVFSHQVHVTSPGALPNSMTPESVRAGRIWSRNESIAKYMQVQQLMENRGRGWAVMHKAMREFNQTEPDLDVNNASVRVIFHLDP